MNKCDCRCPDHEDINIIIDDKDWIYAMAFCPECDNFHDLGNIYMCDFCKKEFKKLDDGEIYCKGIVFSLDEME